MIESKTKSIVLGSLFWKFMEQAGGQGIQFAVQIILARLLSPEDFGLIALVTIFIAIAKVFVIAGLSSALIQGKDVSAVDYSSIFLLNLGLACIMYVLVYLLAPLVARYYAQPEITSILRTLEITLLLAAFSTIQDAIIRKEMQFRKLFIGSLGGVIVSGIAGIALAYNGYGVWALVWQQIIYQSAITFILWLIVKWRPVWAFSLARVLKLFSYGWKLLLSSLIDITYVNVHGLLIGKMYTPATLGYFNRGKLFPQVIVTNTNGAIQAVMFSALSAEQDDTIQVKSMVKRSLKTSTFMLFPLMLGLIAVAESMVRVVLTDKWLPTVPFIRIFCISFAFWPVHTLNLQAINALGRSDIFLKLEIAKKVLGITILMIFIQWGVYALALGIVFSEVLAVFINIYPNKALINYGYVEQFVDIAPSLLISAIMALVVYGIGWTNLSDYATLTVQVLLGGFIYFMLAFLLKLDSYTYLINLFHNMYRRRNQKSEIQI